MKKEVKILLHKSIDSIILAVDHFNRIWDCGRQESVLIFLDHSFELILKAALLNKKQRIREKRKSETFGFDKCVTIALTNKIISEDQVLTLQTTNSLRDAAQHYFVELSESHLYFQAQSSLTVFRDILKYNFEKSLSEELPERVLPISTTPVNDLNVFFEDEIDKIKQLLSPGRRRKVEASSRIRGIIIFDKAIQGEKFQPSPAYINKKLSEIKQNRTIEQVFPGISSVKINAEGSGPSICLRITKKEGAPVQLVPEGTPGATVISVRRVNELDYYNLSLSQVAEKVELTSPKTNALIKHLKLKDDDKYYKQIKIGKSSVFNRYSQETIKIIKENLPFLDMKSVWDKNKPKRGK
jgi:hypothetical protein